MQANRSAFDDTAKEQVRTKLPIDVVVGRYVKLRQAGQNLKGLCPFHKEKTPSFIVSPHRGTFHCFGCGKGGDIFTFYQEMEGVDFKEALRMLAQDAGVQLPTHAAAAPAPAENGPRIPKTAMLAIHQMAMRFFYDQMKASPAAIEYFKSRGLTGETVREFCLGYAPAGWNNLVDHARQFRVSPDALVESGLAIKPESGERVYDRFRDRIMFTLFDAAGHPIAFAGRSVRDDVQPKYLNSPETPIYHKSRTLYGLHKARQYIKDENSVVIVEGYMDYLALYQAGIRNVVATSGTALTADHAQMIRRFTQTVTLLFDGDSAGITAAERASFTLAPYNLSVRVLILPDGLDPDEFVQANGAQALRDRVAGARPAFDFLEERALQQHRGATPEEKSRVVEFLTPYLAAVRDDIASHEYVKHVSERLSIDQGLVRRRIAAEAAAQATAAATPPAALTADSYLRSPEMNFLRILVTNPSMVAIAQQFNMQPQTLTDSTTADLYSLLLRSYARDASLCGLLDDIDDPESKRVFSFLLTQPPRPETAQEELQHTICRLQAKYLRHMEREITERLKKDPENAQLLQKRKEISLQRKELGT